MRNETFSFICNIRVDNLITDLLVEEWHEIEKKCQIETEEITLTVNTIKALGTYLLPWYLPEGWAKGRHYRVKEYPRKITLQNKKDEIRITVAQDSISNQRIIVDGSHRAVAIYQAPQEVKGSILILRSPHIREIFPNEFFAIWKEV